MAKWIQGLELVPGEPRANANLIYEGRTAIAQVYGLPSHTDTDDPFLLSKPEWAAGRRHARLIEAAPDMLEALREAQRVFDEALPKFNWAQSTLDADAIRLLNEVPAKVANLLRAFDEEEEKR